MTHNNLACGNYYDPFYEFFFGKENKNHGVLPMKTDIEESEKAFRLYSELPGFSKEGISVDYKDGVLTISATTSKNEIEKGFESVRRERFEGTASRQFYLGDIDEKAIKASYKDGVLIVEAPKLIPEETKPFKIQIQ